MVPEGLVYVSWDIFRFIDWLIVHNGGTGGIGCEEEEDPELSHSSFHLLGSREAICKLIKSKRYVWSIPEIVLNLNL